MQRKTKKIAYFLGLLLPLAPVSEAVADGVNASVPAESPPISSQVARQELQALLDQGLDSLAPELAAKGTFFPFAVMTGHDGEMRMIGTEVHQRQNPPDHVVKALVDKTRQLAQERRIRAVGFFMDYVAERRDTGFSQAGIRVELMHIQPDALSVFIPYSVTGDNKLRLMTPQYNQGKNVVFSQQPKK